MQQGHLSNLIVRLWPIFLLANIFGAEMSASPKSFENLAVKNEKGEVVPLTSLRKDQEVLVLVFAASTCPVTSLYWERIKGIWYNYRDRKVAIYIIGGNSDDSPVLFRSSLKDQNLELPLLWDEGHMLAKTFGIEFTPEVVLLGKNGEIFYSGRIDDSWRDETHIQQHYLDHAITIALEGKKTDDHLEDLFTGSHLR